MMGWVCARRFGRVRGMTWFGGGVGGWRRVEGDGWSIGLPLAYIRYEGEDKLISFA